MRRRQGYGKENEKTILLPEYGKQKLLAYAQSFKELADAFQGAIPAEAHTKDREHYLWQRRLMENRDLLAMHLNEMAALITNVAEESYDYIELSEKKRKQIIRAFREQGIQIKDIYIMETDRRRLQISITMRMLTVSMLNMSTLSARNISAFKERVFTVDEVADFISVLFDTRLLPVKNSLFFLRQEYETVVFEEEAKYDILTGVAKTVKGNEQVSGDNYTVTEIQNGEIVMALSDGMGSGEKACGDSEKVIELLERFLEAGFSKTMAVEMINSALVARAEEQNMSTLDICDIDLYQGKCDFLKAGASYTFIKRGDYTEAVFSSALPLGIFYHMDMEIQTRQLQEGDYVIMMSDGVLDSIPGDEKEAALQDFLARLSISNPQELANRILQFAIGQSGGKIQDDMTVLTMGIWESN